MNIFESLENLEVSEACFNEIMDMVEAYLKPLDSTSHIRRAHGEPAYDHALKDANGIGYGTPDVPANKSAELIKKSGNKYKKATSDEQDNEDFKNYRSIKKSLKRKGIEDKNILRKAIEKTY